MNTQSLGNRCLRRMVFGVMVALPFCWLIRASSETRAGDDSERIDPDGFLTEFRQTVSHLESLYKNVQVQGTHVTTRSNPGKPPVKTVDTGFYYARSDGREKLLLGAPDDPRPDNPVSGTAVVNSGSRKFRLARKQPGGSWSVEIDQNVNEELPGLMLYRNWLTVAPYGPGCVSLFSEYIGSPDFGIQDVSRTTDGGMNLVKVIFQYAPKGAMSRAQGWLRLDPAMSGVIRDYDFETRNPWAGDFLKKAPALGARALEMARTAW